MNRCCLLPAAARRRVHIDGCPKLLDTLTGFSLARITGAGGQLSLLQLGLTERSLELAGAGNQPGRYARTRQFQATLSQLKRNRDTLLSDVAYDNGYADQSHFIRSFRAFAGVPPSQWQQQALRECNIAQIAYALGSEYPAYFFPALIGLILLTIEVSEQGVEGTDLEFINARWLAKYTA